MAELFEKLYLKSVAFHRFGFHRPVNTIIFLKSFIAPLFKWGIDSATTEISRSSVLQHKSISIGRIPKVLPAEVPPCIPFVNLVSPKTLFITVVRTNIGEKWLLLVRCDVLIHSVGVFLWVQFCNDPFASVDF